MKKNILKNLILILSAVFMLNGCNGRKGTESMSEDLLFSLNYGNFADEISPSDLNKVGAVRYGIAMQDGFFYIVDGCSNKILEMNSYGDLLTLFYNEDSELSSILKKSESSADSFTWEITFPFDFNGPVAVDSSKTIYAVCNLPDARKELTEEGLLCTQVIMRMTRDGSSIDYIGIQGPGGSPYPNVKNIYITKSDELVVVCNTNTGIVVYWYSKEGFLKNTIPVSLKNIPMIKAASAESEVYLTLDNIIPDPVDYKIYIKADYYNSYIDEDSRIQSGINFVQTLLYPMNCDTGVYDEPVSIPSFEESIIIDYSKLTYKVPYDFVGVTPNGWKYFIIKTSDGFDIQMLQSESQKLIRRHFNVDLSQNLFFNLYLSQDGIVTMLYLDKDKPKIVWYRTDSLIDALLKN